MPVTPLTSAQSGLTVDDIVQVIADDWGYNTDDNRFKNATKRRLNRAIRDIQIRLPKMRKLRVHQATANLISGTAVYDVTRSEEDGGFGWTDCVEVLTLVFNEIDNRPVERLSLEQFRERSQIISYTGPPESWVDINEREIRIFPEPDSAYSGFGDYLTELPSITDGSAQLQWPRSWDEAIMAGTEYHTAKARMRERPSTVRQYREAFMAQVVELDIWEKTLEARPQPAQVTRALRSRRTIPRDNSTDLRSWR